MRAQMAKRSRTKALPPQDRLNTLLKYDPEAGAVYWSRPTANCLKIGDPAGHIMNHGYHAICVDGTAYLTHRLIWKMMTGNDPIETIDHINGNKSDNRWANLRPATCRQNRWNTTKQNGVRFKRDKHLNKRWNACLWLSPTKQLYIGNFATKEEALAARQAKARELRGEYAPPVEG